MSQEEFEQILLEAEKGFRKNLQNPAKALPPFMPLFFDVLIYQGDWRIPRIHEAAKSLSETAGLKSAPRSMRVFCTALAELDYKSGPNATGAMNMWVYCRSGFQHIAEESD